MTEPLACHDVRDMLLQEATSSQTMRLGLLNIPATFVISHHYQNGSYALGALFRLIEPLAAPIRALFRVD